MTFFTSRNSGKKSRFSLGFTQGVDGAVVLEGMSCIMLSNPHHSWKNYGYPHFLDMIMDIMDIMDIIVDISILASQFF